jgi:shikimate dehydrogenase
VSDAVNGEAVPRPVRGTTRLSGVLGWPVAGSLSPVIHNAAFAALGLDWVYLPLPVEPGHVGAAITGLQALGFAGANVTMPHKAEAAAAVPQLSEDAARLDAVNTIHVGAEGISGHNTDAPGFARFLEEDVGFDAGGRSALLFGAGGAARAVALALARAGLARLSVALREPARANVLAAALEGFPTRVEAIAFEDARAAEVDLLVNATPLGAHGEELPLPRLDRVRVAVDLLYRPPTTPLLAVVRDAGGASFGGLGLLLHQAALAFELWTGQPAPLDVMSAAALAELADPGSTDPAPAGPGGGPSA